MANLIFIGGPGVPSINQIVVLMFLVFVPLWLLNTLYDWLKTKPWKKKIVQPPPSLHSNPPHNGV